MKLTTKQIATTAALLAICIVSQFFKNTSVYITGPVINACIILAGLCGGLICGIILSLITPVTAFFISGSPVISAIPAIMPCIMAGNALLVSCICLLKSRFKGKSGLLFSMLIGCLLKALFMGIAISLLLIPAFLPEKLHPQMRVFQMTFSVVQLVTAVTGIVYAMILQIPIRKYLNREA